jgi:hypothetical protein
MLTFPLHNAALALKGKPPGELPHGLLPVPPEVRELVATERVKHPGHSEEAWRRSMNLWAVTWYYDGLGHEVLYRETPQGPEVLAVGLEEIAALTDGMKPEKMAGLHTYEG